jgi:hypothetical protein
MRFSTAAAIALAMISTSAFAQTRTLNVKYSGVVTNDVTDTIMIRQPDGTVARYTGNVPNYEFKKGDNVTISFDTTMPTKAYYDAGTAPKSADGIYRFQVGTRVSGVFGFGSVENPDVTGSLGPRGLYVLSGLTIVYDANNETYSIEFRDSGFFLADVQAPSYLYDANTGALLSSPTNCFTPAECGGGGLIAGNATEAKLTVDTGRSDGVTDPQLLGRSGSFTLGFSGGWNLPTYEPTQVPEPASIGIFAGGLFLLQRARRRRALQG